MEMDNVSMVNASVNQDLSVKTVIKLHVQTIAMIMEFAKELVVYVMQIGKELIVVQKNVPKLVSMEVTVSIINAVVNQVIKENFVNRKNV